MKTTKHYYKILNEDGSTSYMDTKMKSCGDVKKMRKEPIKRIRKISFKTYAKAIMDLDAFYA